MDEKTIKALGDPKRYLLLTLLAGRRYCVRALAVKSGLSESAVSQHMKILREAGLVYGVKLGYYTHYQLDRDAIGKAAAALEDLRRTQSRPCGGRPGGCPEAAQVRCRAYVPPEKETEKD